MSFADSENPYASFGLAIDAPKDERAAFIGRTYMHLAGAVAAFVALEVAWFNIIPMFIPMQQVVGTMLSGWNWLIVLGLFIGASWIAESWARNATSLSTQYAGLSLYVFAESIIFVPILFIATAYSAPFVLPAAAILTLLMFGGLSVTVYITRHDFSYLRPILSIGVLAAIGLILLSVLFGFDLGIFFTVAMIAFACGYILYDTSNVLHHYRTDQHVSASLALFASLALLFWYVLRLLMYLNRR